MRHSLVILAFALTALVLAAAIDRARFPQFCCCAFPLQKYPDLFEFSLDLEIDGDGYFQIQASDGSLQYTRDGRFHTNETWTLVDSAGDSLIPPVSLPMDTTELAVATDGSVTVTTASNPALKVIIGSVYVASFPGPDSLKLVREGTYEATADSGSPVVEEPGTNNTAVLIPKSIQRRLKRETDLTDPLVVDPSVTTHQGIPCLSDSGRNGLDIPHSMIRFTTSFVEHAK